MRLTFGIHSAQEVFHRVISGNFIDINGVETDTLGLGQEYKRSQQKSHNIIRESKGNWINNELVQV